MIKEEWNKTRRIGRRKYSKWRSNNKKEKNKQDQEQAVKIIRIRRQKRTDILIDAPLITREHVTISRHGGRAESARQWDVNAIAGDKMTHTKPKREIAC